MSIVNRQRDKQSISGSKLRIYRHNWPISTNNQLKEGLHHKIKKQSDIKTTFKAAIQTQTKEILRNKANQLLE